MTVSHIDLHNDPTTGTPAPEVSWFKDNQKVEPTKDRRVTLDFDIKQGLHILTIRDAIHEDEGLFILRVVNETGSVSITVRVTAKTTATLEMDETFRQQTTVQQRTEITEQEMKEGFEITYREVKTEEHVTEEVAEELKEVREQRKLTETEELKETVAIPDEPETPQEPVKPVEEEKVQQEKPYQPKPWEVSDSSDESDESLEPQKEKPEAVKPTEPTTKTVIDVAPEEKPSIPKPWEVSDSSEESDDLQTDKALKVKRTEGTAQKTLEAEFAKKPQEPEKPVELKPAEAPAKPAKPWETDSSEESDVEEKAGVPEKVKEFVSPDVEKPGEMRVEPRDETELLKPRSPKIEVAPEPIVFDEGEQITLSCRVSGQQIIQARSELCCQLQFACKLQKQFASVFFLHLVLLLICVFTCSRRYSSYLLTYWMLSLLYMMGCNGHL